MFVLPAQWDAKKERTKGKSREQMELNTLSEISIGGLLMQQAV